MFARAQPRTQLPSPELAELPPAILERLAAEGVTTFEQWLALGSKRRAIFGITRATVRHLDALARGAPP
jgi:hypothetical protein